MIFFRIFSFELRGENPIYLVDVANSKCPLLFYPQKNFSQLLWVMRKRSCTSAGNAQAQLHFRDDQERAFADLPSAKCPTF